jgi:hypothetical protein
VLCAEQNKVSHLQLGGSHSLLQAFGSGLLGPAEVIPCFQDAILEVLGEIFHSWAGELVGNGCEPASSQWQRHQINMHNGLNVASTSLEPEGHQGTSRAQAQLEKSDHFSAKSFSNGPRVCLSQNSGKVPGLSTPPG